MILLLVLILGYSVFNMVSEGFSEGNDLCAPEEEFDETTGECVAKTA